jgi:muramoyltetrapeptide carboxypeptidase
VTTLHLFLNQTWGWPSLHASLVDRLARLMESSLATGGKPVPPAEQVAELLRVIRGEQEEIQFQELEVLHRGRGDRIRKGVSGGGNLVTWASALATPLHPKTTGRILVFEDIGERGYRVDRLLEQLRQAKVFNEKTVAVIFGEFTGDQEPGGEATRVPAVIERFAQQVGREFGIAVLRGLPVGHGVQQRSLPLGVKSELDLRNGSWTLRTGGQAGRTL